ncbi:M48 family metallopeptidase [Nocardiopsis akebiae]|uniref:M48 family metallopeptidase n=1 Tax=Nocardiopsis akebiae TaxID=2831968 RepID=A0ABX8BXL7_9ACTN|nr:M48 family metallopeptidase [Nocardiopsis akebiae]
MRYRNHGKQFKAMMTALVPNWREFDKQRQHVTENVGQGRQEMEG